MSNQVIPSNEDLEHQQPVKQRGVIGFLLLWAAILGGLGMVAMAFLPPESPYALPRYFWYADFRFWPSWVISCCWLTFLWGCVSILLFLLVPRSEDRMFLLRRSFLLKALTFSFAVLLFVIWYNYATLPLATLFSPIISPVVNYVYRHYTIPLADFYTIGEGANPLFWPISAVIILAVVFISWRIWCYIRRWRRRQTTVMIFALAIILPTVLGADDLAPVPPKKVETSVGIYDVQSKYDLANFTADEIRELVRIEDDRIRGAGKPPHPILVYCFEERTFHYTGGKYDNAEIPYRLHVPSKIVPGKKYPLVIHLHGIGEAGDHTTMSLAHLHSILPLLTGPKQQDFYLLVTQCPQKERTWKFMEERDGTLDIALAALNHTIETNPIDVDRISVFGLSSGGSGAWQLVMNNPDHFAAFVPTSAAPPRDKDRLSALKNTMIWTFRNKSDNNARMVNINYGMHIINGSGGYMKLTQFDQGGHAAWRPAMDEYNCFSWMIAQKRGGWFNPPPERKVYQGRSLSNCFFSFFLPLGLAAGLFAFQRTALCERLHERIADRLYRRDEEDEDEYEDDDESTDDFRTLTDASGTKKITAKIVGFQGDAVKIQSSDGKIVTVAIKHFSQADQEWLREQKPEQPLSEDFRTWSNAAGTQSFVAKFVGFQGDDKILVQSQAGKTAPVSINQLGQAEQEFLASRRSEAASDPPVDGFRTWTDNTGAKKITAKLVDFLPDGKVRLEFQTGKITTVDPKYFCEANQQWLQEQKPVN